jgi:beta-phosphoglucomutase-like phosphatase (HAD superfamily)
MAIEAVVFDVDGVLIDAREWHYEALNRALDLIGYRISRFDHISTYDGLSTRQKLEMLSIERSLPRPLHGFLNELKQRYTMELVNARCNPVFQHEFTLSGLSSAGYKLAVASNSVRRTVEAMMERSQLAGYLDAMISNEDVTKPKPDPEIYRVTLERLAVEPGRALVIEDNEYGIAAAQAAGAHVMVVTSPLEVTSDRVTAKIRELDGATS